MRDTTAGVSCGESFVPGGSIGAACWESFIPVWPAVVSCGESFVPEVVLCAVQSSPCSACWWLERYKVLPASEKWLGIAVLWCVGRVLSRVGPSGPPAGRVLYRFDPPGFRVGRVLSRRWSCVRYKVLPARLASAVGVKKFSLQARNGLVSPFCGVLGEFCPGWVHRGRLLGEFYTGLARRGFVWGEFCPGCAFDVRSRGSFVPLIG